MDVLWINIEYIARLIKRFTLQTVRKIPEAIPLLRMVVPVTSVDDLLKTLDIHVFTVSCTGNGYLDMGAVPADERWTVYAAFYLQSSGTFNVATLTLNKAAVNIPINTPAASTSAFKFFEQVVPVDSGWFFEILISGHAVTGNCALRLLVEKSKSY